MQRQHKFPPKSQGSLQDGFANLARGTYFREAPLDVMLGVLSESAASMSGVERVSIWAFTDQQSLLHCIERYSQSTGEHATGETLRAEDFPRFFQALQAGICIAADDASVHPMTAEFAQNYLVQHKVLAMLHAPIHVRGVLQGVLCLEQTAAPQAWTTAHRLFAMGVANLVTLALVEHEAEEARRQAADAQGRLQLVLEAAADALLLTDGDSGEILDLNRRAEALLAVRREQLLGKAQGSLFPLDERGRLAGLMARLSADAPQQITMTEVQRPDGACLPVELSVSLATPVRGRRLALSAFRSF